jgi:hypothetical protein
MLKQVVAISAGVVLWLALLSGLILVERSSSSPIDYMKSDHGAQEERGNRKPDEKLADYTLWLERFTGLLVFVSAFRIIFLIHGPWNYPARFRCFRKGCCRYCGF